jgi:hypothetical protein
LINGPSEGTNENLSKARKQQEVEKELEENAKKEQRTAGGERGRRWRSRQAISP